MTRTPGNKKPKKPSNYEHLILQGPGFWTLPDLIRCEGVAKGRWTNILVIQASTYEERSLAIPLLIPTVASLVAAPPTVARFETPTSGRQIEPPKKGKILEVSVLDRFVCFRAITADWRTPEFLTQKDQHILVPFSSKAYKQLLDHLKALSNVR